MNNNNNDLNEFTMNTIKNTYENINKRSKNMMKTINKTPFVQKMIIIIIVTSLIIILIKYIFNHQNNKNRFKPYYLETINNTSEPYSVFNGSVVNNNCVNNDCAIGVGNSTNSIYSNSDNNCCIIKKNNFKETEIGYMTYSFWIYVYTFNSGSNSNKINYENIIGEEGENNWKHVWHRGNETIETGEKYNNTAIQYPGVWLNPNLEVISFKFNNGEDVIEQIDLDITTYNKWVNYSVVLNKNVVSVYENGKLENTIMLKQKNISTKLLNVYLGSQGIENNGFPGYLSYFTYFNEVYNSDDINKLYHFYKIKMDKYIKMENNYLVNQMLDPLLITDKNMD